jgi:thiamine-phosphate pyrophosphorylase
MAITDGRIDALVDRVAAAVDGGATCVQVRLKHEPARIVAALTRAIVARVSVPVLVNDRFDIALAAEAAGVHVGADDISVSAVRRVVPPGFIIGTSVGCDAEVANAAEADYVGIGPVYATGSKHDAGDAIGLDEFTRLGIATGKPAIGVGGITVSNARAVLDAGGAGIAVIGAIFDAADSRAAAAALYRAIET